MLCFTGFYWVLLGFTESYGAVEHKSETNSVILGYSWLLLSVSPFHKDLIGILRVEWFPHYLESQGRFWGRFFFGSLFFLPPTVAAVRSPVLFRTLIFFIFIGSFSDEKEIKKKRIVSLCGAGILLSKTTFFLLFKCFSFSLSLDWFDNCVQRCHYDGGFRLRSVMTNRVEKEKENYKKK